MTRLRIDLAYDGTPYAGFARQPDQETVQGTLEGALARVLGRPVEITCAGRTDRGVHALAQVVHLDLDPTTSRREARAAADPTGLRRRLTKILGDAITIWRVATVDDDFDARFSATWRAYRYRLVEAPADPRTRLLAWHVPDRVDADLLAAGLPVLLGENDFAAFCRKAPGRPTTRRLLEAAVAPGSDGELHLTFRGNAFCHQQVRAMVGSLVEVARSRRPVEWLGTVLESGDRALAGPVAPAHGLTLEGVGYVAPYEVAPVPPEPPPGD